MRSNQSLQLIGLDETNDWVGSHLRLLVLQNKLSVVFTSLIVNEKLVGFYAFNYRHN